MIPERPFFRVNRAWLVFSHEMWFNYKAVYGESPFFMEIAKWQFFFTISRNVIWAVVVYLPFKKISSRPTTHEPRPLVRLPENWRKKNWEGTTRHRQDVTSWQHNWKFFFYILNQTFRKGFWPFLLQVKGSQAFISSVALSSLIQWRIRRKTSRYKYWLRTL